jgi:uncharacterized membrane protein
VVHLPVGVLLVAWIPILIGLIDHRRRTTWFACGALLLVISAFGCVIAVMTGETAQGIVGAPSQIIADAIHAHQSIALRTRNLVIATTFVFMAAWIVYAKVRESAKRRVLFVGSILAAITYASALIALVNAGHSGGVLVHTHGVRAPIVP